MPGGMIGMASGDQLRFSQFVTGLMGLDKPNGTVFIQSYGLSVATNWNIIAKQFLKHPDHLEWLLLIEDDHLLPQRALTQLLSHDLDIVSALYLQRRIPFPPIMFDRIDEKGKIYHRFLKTGDKGLIQVAACGGGCILIRRKVLETMKPPYWFYGESTYIDSCNHDINFCRKAKSAGFSIWVDLDLPIHHLAVMPIIARRNKKGEWITLLQQTDDKVISVGAATSE